MKGKILATLGSIVVTAAAHSQVTVNIYDGFGTTGGGAPYSDFVGSFNSANVRFGTDTSFNWHPFSRQSFGAELVGGFQVSVSGLYTFGLTSDDGSMLYINNVLNIDNGGPHGPNFVAGTPVQINAGECVPFRIEFFEDFGGDSGLDLFVQTTTGGFELVNDDMFCPVPEPSTLAAVGLASIILLRRRRR